MYIFILPFTNGSWCYFVKGVTDESYSNLVNYNKGWYYVQKGVLNWKYTGLVRHTNGVSYYVQNGKINFSYSGTVSGKRVVNGVVK